MKTLLIAAASFVFFIVLSCPAFSNPAGYIIFAEGDSFSINSRGKLTYYDIFENDVTGMEILKGDTISTEKSSFLEIQLAATSNVIKVSEHTTFTVTSSGASQESSLNLSYGRLRAKVAQIVGTGFSIKGPSAIAGVRGTDFGYDFILDPQAGFEEAVTQVYCFEGSVEVTKIAKTPETEEMIETVTLSGDQMIAINQREISLPTPIVSITEEVNIFWEINDFSGTLINLTPPSQETTDEAIADTKLAKEPTPAPVDEKPTPVPPAKDTGKLLLKKQLAGIGVGLLITGLLVEGGGIATYVAGPTIFSGLTGNDGKNIGTAVMIAGGSIITGAIISFISSALIK